MQKMLLVSEVAALAKIIEKAKLLQDQEEASVMNVPSASGEQLRGIALAKASADDDESALSNPLRDGVKAFDDEAEKVIKTDSRDPLTGSLHSSERAKLMLLLGRWEEPDKDQYTNNVSSISLSQYFFAPYARLANLHMPFLSVVFTGSSAE
jgi:hypothetical protein